MRVAPRARLAGAAARPRAGVRVRAAETAQRVCGRRPSALRQGVLSGQVKNIIN